MMKKHSFLLITTLVLQFFTPSLFAQNETISTTIDSQGWLPANVRADSTVAITSTQPRIGQVSALGDSSIEFETMFMTAGQDKADYQFIWQTSLMAIDFPNRTLDNLTDVSYEYYRDSSSAVAANLHTPLRLTWLHDSNTPADPTDDTFGIFIYEAVYQPGFGGTIATDTWLSENIFSSEFWVFCSDCDPTAAVTSGVVQNFDVTLSDWASGQQTGAGGDPVPPDLSIGTTYIIGINTGVGSGWGADSLMYVDNIRIAFGANDDQIFNFEDDLSAFAAPTSVPTLSFYGYLVMLLLIGLIVFIKRNLHRLE
jgi:hypothetical protein